MSFFIQINYKLKGAIALLSLVSFFIATFPSCIVEDELAQTNKIAAELPILSTSNLSVVGETNATIISSIISDGGGVILSKGVCWNTVSNPTIVNGSTNDGNENSSYTSDIVGLIANTTYYVRSYATNSAGTTYGNQIKFVTNGTIADIEGNVYHTITIGSQKWMVENLKTTRFNDGAPISLVIDPITWGSLTTAGYCWYNNLSTNKTTYGALYNWTAVNNGKLALAGWHVPTDADWKILSDYLGGEAVAGSKLKGIGFIPVFGGNRASDGTFNGASSVDYWWSSTQSNTTNAWQISFGSTNSDFLKQNNAKSRGFSVRCVRDN